ncbi:phage terminase small subunit [Sphingomonas sp.]|uniref:phage terminase small subunit n=1 Tax=Sphingomonas sp. TaxID=28214 RepID=UPI003568F759
MSLARQHRDRTLAAKSAVHSAMEGGLAGPVADLAPTAADTAHAQISMRLTHDLRRLKEIQSIERKIEAKREMLPHYRPWIEGLLAASEATGEGVQDEVLPTIMIWLIDVGDFEAALLLADYVLRHNVALPARYARSAPALIAEDIAAAALKAQMANESFDVEILYRVEELTADHDMHDEIRAKLQKAIGFELADHAEAFAENGPDRSKMVDLAEQALVHLRRAQQLHDRAGAKDKIKRLEKLLVPPKTETAGTTG